MCDPTAAIGIGSALVRYVGDQQAAADQEAANAASRNLAIQNQNLQIRALQNAEDEEARRADEALRENSLAADAVRATASVAAGEAGVAGLSVDALLGDLNRQETENKNDVLQTQDFGQRQRQLDREGIGITAQSQVNQLPLVQYPSFFDTAFQIGSAGYDGYERRADSRGKPKT